MPEVVKVFISYAYSDIEYKERIEKFLKKNVARNKVQLVADSTIRAGEDWNKRSGRLYNYLYSADLYILLLTRDYLGSELLSQEALLIIDNAKKHKRKVLPVFLKYCEIPEWIANTFEIFPNPFEPIVSHQVEESISRSQAFEENNLEGEFSKKFDVLFNIIERAITEFLTSGLTDNLSFTTFT